MEKDSVIMNETIKTALDALSVGTVVGAILGLLPAIAALFTIIWTGIRIWESETVRGWRTKRGS